MSRAQYDKKYCKTQKKIEEIWAESKRLGRRIPSSHALYRNLMNYTCPTQFSYRPDFAEAYNKAYPLVYSSEQKIKEIWAESKRLGKRLKRDHPLSSALYRYAGTKSKFYQPDFAEAYNKAYPLVDTAEQKIKEIWAESKRLSKRIPKNHPLRNALDRYINPNKSTHRPHFAKTYNKAYPPRSHAVTNKRSPNV